MPRKRDWEINGARMVRDKGLYVLQLNGTPLEMGCQYGELIRNVCGAMNIDYYAGLVGRLLKHSNAMKDSAPVVRRVAHDAIDSFFTSNAYRNYTTNMRDITLGLMKTLELPPKTIQSLGLAMDISHVLMSMQFGYLTGAGCSALVAKDSAVTDGKLILGRNYDFHGAGFWDIYPAVVVYNPKKGMKVISVTTLGIPHGSVSINEEGLILSVYANYTKDLAADGMPGYSLWDKVIGECRNIDEALKVIAATKRICGFTFIIIDKSRNVVAVEMSANKHEVIRIQGDIMARSNNYLSPKMQKDEAVWETMYHYNDARYSRILELLLEKRGNLDAQTAIDIMGDHTDYFERHTALAGNVVGTVCNINCTVVSPDESALWIGTGRAPACNSAEFAGLSISDLFSGGNGFDKVPDLRGDRILSREQALAVRAYVEAWTEHFDNFDDERALERLEEAMTHVGDQPVLKLMAGVTAMKVGRFYDALDHLESYCQMDFKQPENQVRGWLWLGRTHDILEHRHEALDAYAKALSSKIETLASKARKHLQKPYSKTDLKTLELEFILATPLEE